MKARFTQLTVTPEGEPIFDERAYTVTIDDRGAGEYVAVHSLGEDGDKIDIDPQDWPALREAIDTLMKECQS